MATIETSDLLIPSDVYLIANESLELKCLFNAHIEKANEVKSNIATHFICSSFFVFVPIGGVAVVIATFFLVPLDKCSRRLSPTPHHQ